ncbi:hypothetical protein PENTCL1PPCAC_17856 [Pristionchus entomophagus]|uniref:J domain-containing protein n=1 Tax=Pristionchus entomophagus TaxID=358040 RepID=A0AAV5TMX0_9BILA|nr:hypothetical protein PENTCL1PPCAC_17856 [Pristionchus entomophagus]
MDFGLEEKRGELYEVIGCSESSSKEQIITEYRLRAREMHPDKTGEKHDKIAFLKIQEAMSVLGDEVRRSRYNEWLHSPLPISFDQFEKNISAVKQSTHWATAPSIPMIHSTNINENNAVVMENWSKNRYQSDSAAKFRNYEL